MSYVSGPVKRTGHKLDVYKQSVTREEMLGTKWVWDSGETFRYAYARAALTAGKMALATAIDTNLVNIAATTSYTTGTKVIAQTITALTYAIPENGLQGSKLIVNDDYGQGHSYPIIGNTAVSTSDTTINIIIGKGLIHQFVASGMEITIAPNPWGGPGVYHAALTSMARLMAVGVPLIDVTAGYYCWLQTGGICSCLVDAGATQIGAGVTASILTSGAIGPTYHTAAANTTGCQIVGVGVVIGVSTEYNGVYLTID